MTKLKNLLVSLVLLLSVNFALFGAANFVVVEAESGTVGSSFKTVEGDGAKYITVLYTLGGLTPDTASRVNTYTVTFPDTGTYDLYLRYWVEAGGADDDSYYYGTTFGTKDLKTDADWVRVNNISGKGYTIKTELVEGLGNSANKVWVWINLSKFAGDEPAKTFKVLPGELTQTFQMAGRENGLRIDKFAFGLSSKFFTVKNLENGENGGDVPPGTVVVGPPIGEGLSKFIGCAYGSDTEKDFEGYWNQVTPGNASKWGSVEGTRNVMNWAELDKAYNFAKKHKFPFKFHTLIWGGQQPAWIEALDSATQRQEIEQWYSLVAARYPEIEMIDVVNEPIHQAPDKATKGNYIKALGGTGTTGWDWVITSFKLARKYFPKSKLIINEYSVTNSTETTTTYAKIVRLLQKDTLIDGVGFQAHAFSTNGVDAALTKKNLDTIANTGLPLYVTEFDIDGPTDVAQLREYMRIMPVFWEHPKMAGFTFWGFRPGMWRSDTKAYLVNTEGEERPAFTWIRAYVQGKFKPITTVAITSGGNATTITKAADTLRLTATCTPNDATLSKYVSWSIKDTTIATITADGLVKAKKDGVVVITATSYESASVKATFELTISGQPGTTVNINKAAIFSVSPNPVVSELKLNNASDIVNIEITNMMGQSALRVVNLESGVVNVSGLQNGMYVLKAYNKTGSAQVVKFVKR